MSKPDFDKNYVRRKLTLVLRDLDHYTAEEFWREISRIAHGATGLPSAEQLQTRVKELEDMAKDYREKVRSWASKALHENAEKHRLEAEIADLRRRAEQVRIALSERTNRLQALRQA